MGTETAGLAIGLTGESVKTSTSDFSIESKNLPASRRLKVDTYRTIASFVNAYYRMKKIYIHPNNANIAQNLFTKEFISVKTKIPCGREPQGSNYQI